MSDYFTQLKKLQENAHAPYSNYQVAAILVLENGEQVQGVNVENASYGGTICAERSAIVSAVSQYGKQPFKEMHLLAGDNDNFAMPCGFCRQVISEFVPDSFSLFVYTADGQCKQVSMGELLPYSFSKDDLN